MTIQQALHTAVTGGYQVEGSDGVATYFSGANSEYSVWTRVDNHSSFMIPVHETVLDPAFWQALGRALGWDTPCALAITCVAGQKEGWRGHGAYWMYQGHCFIQQLAQGESPDAFFARLPPPPSACTAHGPDAGVHRTFQRNRQRRETRQRHMNRSGRRCRQGAQSRGSSSNRLSQQGLTCSA